MGDEITYTRDGRTYRVRGLDAKARAITGASSEMDVMLESRISAAETALAKWRGPHAVTFTTEANALLAKMAGLKIALWRAATVVQSFPEAPVASWANVRHQDEIYMSAQVDVPVEPGTAAAETQLLRDYAATSSGQDERFPTLAGTVNLDGVSAEVTYYRPLTDAERQRALDRGEHPADLDVTMVPQTESVAPSTLITLPTPSADVPSLTTASKNLGEFTVAVAAAFDVGDQATLALLAQDPGALQARLAWLRQDPRRWSQMTPTEQRIMIHALPAEVGSLNGLPTVVRDQANRIVLQNTRAALEARLAELQRLLQDHRPHPQPIPHPGQTVPLDPTVELSEIEEKLQGISRIERRLAGVPGRPPAFLLGFSGDGDGRAIVAIGNPDHAANVAVYVPGTTARLGLVGIDIERADRMAADANGLDPANATSVIMWLDYDAPDTVPLATSSSYASNAVDALRSFQHGLDVSHVDGGATTTFVGHSYGSTVIGHTAATGHFNADNLVFVGSPGVGVDDVSDLHVDPDHVYATTAANDPIQWSPRFIHNTQPVNPDFGAQVFASDPGSPGGFEAHSQYWDDGNVARDNMAAIVTGHPELVTQPVPQPQPGPSPSPPPQPPPAPPRPPVVPQPTPGVRPTPSPWPPAPPPGPPAVPQPTPGPAPSPPS